MSFYKEVPGRQTTLESTLKFDTTPTAGSTNPVTSGAVKEVEEKADAAAEALQEQIDDIAEKAGSGYTPKGEATVATLNALSGQENGWLYTMTDAGTLTLGSLAVVAGDTVAWDAANSVWYKAMDYAPSQYGTNEVHNLPTTITAFRTGDVIPVDGPSGTAKMPKNDLLRVTAENALGSIHLLSDTATGSDLVAGNYFALDGSTGTKKLSAEDVAKRSVQNNVVPSLAKEFDPTINYKKEEVVTYQGRMRRFRVDHPAGPWTNDTFGINVPAVAKNASNKVAVRVCENENAMLELEQKLTCTDVSGYAYIAGGLNADGSGDSSVEGYTLRNMVTSAQPAPFASKYSRFFCDYGYSIRVCVYPDPVNVGSATFIKKFDGDFYHPIIMDVSGYIRFSISDDTHGVYNFTEDDQKEFLLQHLHPFIASDYEQGVLEQIKTKDNEQDSDIEYVKSLIAEYVDISGYSFTAGGLNVDGSGDSSVANKALRNLVNSGQHAPKILAGSKILCDAGYTIRCCLYSQPVTVGSAYLLKTFSGDNDNPIVITIDGYARWAITDTSGRTYDFTDDKEKEELLSHIHVYLIDSYGDLMNDEKDETDASIQNKWTALVAAQTQLSEEWHFPFINVWNNMGLGAGHKIPGTAKIWNPSGTTDLSQIGVWMSDGVHPYTGPGVTPMYAQTIYNQFKDIVPSYRDSNGNEDFSRPDWNGRKILWMGTSIPAGSDPYAGEGQGLTYPQMVAAKLGATCINQARGSSCLRINSSTGTYDGMIYAQFLRSFTRTEAECDLIASDWANIYPLISGAPSTLPAEDLATMKAHSFENLLIPYLDGTEDMPDAFVIDYGVNDIRPVDINGNRDVYMVPSKENITRGLLAEDSFMTDSSYSNLKTYLNNDLSGISDLSDFAATLDRNCFKGAMNFLVTLILRYNPFARIVFVSHYN